MRTKAFVPAGSIRRVLQQVAVTAALEVILLSAGDVSQNHLRFTSKATERRMKVFNSSSSQRESSSASGGSHQSHPEVDALFLEYVKEKRITRLKGSGVSRDKRAPLRRCNSNTVGADQVGKSQTKKQLRRSKSLRLPKKGQGLALMRKKLEAASEQSHLDVDSCNGPLRKDLHKSNSEPLLDVKSTAAA